MKGTKNSGNQKYTTKQKLVMLAMGFADNMNSKQIGVYASSAAFFILLSMIPILIILSTFIPYLNLREIDLINALTGMLPEGAAAVAATVIDEAYHHSGDLLSLSILIMLWTAAIGMLALIRGLNAVYEVEEKRNYFVLRAISAFYMLLLLILILGVMVLFIYSGVLRRFIGNQFPDLWILTLLMMNGRYLIMAVLAVLLFMVMYTFIPSQRQRFLMQLPGALFTGIGWLIFSYFYSLYVNNTSNYSAIYGSLATLIVTMFWLYWCIYIFLIGAQVNKYFGRGFEAVYDEIYENHITKKEAQKLEPGAKSKGRKRK